MRSLLTLIACLLLGGSANAQWNYTPLLQRHDNLLYRERPVELRIGVLAAEADPDRDILDNPGVYGSLTYTYAFSKYHSFQTGLAFEMRQYYRYDYASAEWYSYSDDVAMLTYPLIYQLDPQFLNMSIRGGLETNVVLWGNRGDAGANNPNYNQLALSASFGVGVRTEDLSFVLDYVAPVVHPISRQALPSDRFQVEDISTPMVRSTLGFRFGLSH